MPAEECFPRSLYGGAISCSLPMRFQDLSNIQEVPNHQEVFADPSRDESLIIELLDYKHDVEDNGSAVWFLQDLGSEQDAKESVAVSKGRQGREAQNMLRVYLANLRLKGAGTDVLITAYEPLFINPLSASARDVGAGPAVPADVSGCLPMAEVFKLAIASFAVHDWSLFGAAS